MSWKNDFQYGIITNTDVMQIEDSLKILADTFNNKCHVNMLEIGCSLGYTSRAIVKKLTELELKDYSYWAIDIYGKTPFEECKFVLGKSEENFMNVPKELHWLFIDGCHCVNHVMLDFLNYGPKIVKNGLLLFHDTSPSVQGRNYQKHGPKIPEFHIAVKMAWDKLDMINKPDWELISNKYDITKKIGGTAIFRRK